MPESPIKLTTEEFEALLLEVYQRGLRKGLYDGLHLQRTFYPGVVVNKHFNELMIELKLKTE